MNRKMWWVCVLAASVLGCGTPPGQEEALPTTGPQATADAGPDAGAQSGHDGGSNSDAGSDTDAGWRTDAGFSTDGGLNSDAGFTTDGGLNSDAGSTTDGGLHTDAGAGVDAGHPPDAGFDAGSTLDAGPGVDAGSRRPVTICLTGACTDLSANCGSNAYFTQLCDELEARDAGLVRSSTGTTFATALEVTAQAVAAPLFAALDRNGDQAVNALDGPIDLTIVGFSWGGENSGDLAARVLADSRIDQTSLTRRVIIIDGFQPSFLSNPSITIPAGVDEAWSFRHSSAPATDCSNGALFGPYLGHRPGCLPHQRCSDYDFSLAPTGVFNGLTGQSIGHCDAPRAAAPYVLELVTRHQLTTPLPPAVAVTP